jgi:hypothetical protein
MSPSATLPTTNQPNVTECNFYIPDEDDTTSMAFRVAYKSVKDLKNNKELCTYVGSMLCSVAPEFRKSVEAALNGLGISPRFVSLPSQASENNIVDSELPEMDRPSILVGFGYCIFLLFKVGDYEYFWFDRYMTYTNRINGLCREVGCPPYNDLDIPFNLQNQYAITSMLSTQTLRFVVASYIHKYLQFCSSRNWNC